MIDCSVLLILVELLTIMVQIRRFYWLGIYNLKIQYSSVGPNVNWFYYFIEFFLIDTRKNNILKMRQPGYKKRLSVFY